MKRQPKLPAGFHVQAKPCSTCIYRPKSGMDIVALERQVADEHGGFKAHRICHHSESVCCAGFWKRHKDQFPAGQIAQRMNAVVFVTVDTEPGI